MHRLLLAVVIGVCVVGGAVVVAPASSAVTTGILGTARATVTTSPNAWQSFVGAVEYDPANITSVTGSATTTAVHVALTGGTGGRQLSIDLVAPTGSTFAPGTYYGDDPNGPHGSGMISESSAGCDFVQFTIVDLASSGSALTRLDARFQTTCSYDSSNVDATIFGELQLGEPEPSSTLATGARSPSWPDVAVNSTSPATWPLWIRNTGAAAVSVGTLTRTGAQSTDFPIVSDGCSHTVLAAHSACSATIGFRPSAAGARSATVTVPVGSTSVSTTLNGTGSPGTTLLRMTSQPGDYVGGGKSYLITDSQEQVHVGTDGPGEVIEGFTSYTNTDDYWTVQIGATGGAAMTVGTHNATRSGVSGTYVLDVNGQSRGCGDSTGSVTIKQVSFNADGAPTAYDATFTQVCTGSTAGLSGEIEYHAGSAARAIYAQDTFNRTVTNGLGVASPAGGAWTTSATPADLSVTPGHAALANGPGQTTGAFLGSVTQIGTDLLTSFALKAMPVGGNGYYLRVIGRRVTDTEQYYAFVHVAPNGQVTLALAKFDGSTTDTPLSTTQTIGTVAADVGVHVRLDTTRISPTTLRAKAWVGSTEPSTWTATAADASSVLQAHGSPGLSTYLSGGNTSGPVTAYLPSFTVAAA